MDGVGGGSPYTMQAMQSQSQVGDQQQAQTIQAQSQAEVKKNVMERWKIEKDSQTKQNEIIQDVNVNKAKVGDASFKKWDEYIRG